PASMEPPSSLGGMSLLAGMGRRPRVASLQWSRRVHSAECLFLRLRALGKLLASMEPPSSLGGMDRGTLPERHRVIPASMEPPSSLGGMHVRPGGCGIPVGASMEPPSSLGGMRGSLAELLCDLLASM